MYGDRATSQSSNLHTVQLSRLDDRATDLAILHRWRITRLGTGYQRDYLLTSGPDPNLGCRTSDVSTPKMP
jgi:hypothetical protein